MVSADGLASVEEQNSGSRKKSSTGGKRKILKDNRYAAPKRPLIFVPCKHNTKRFSCVQIKPNDIKAFKQDFFKVTDKVRQDNIISHLVSTSHIKRRRPRPTNQNKKQKPGGQHKYNVSYYLPTCNDSKISVCLKFFLSITGVGRTRVKNNVQRVKVSVHHGKAIEENRGGDRLKVEMNRRKKALESI